MSKRTYHLELRGYVGGYDFNLRKVKDCLATHQSSHVDVLIDSTGGSLATGLSIRQAFADHGDVTVHMSGLCASAATIASMGAKHITIDSGAFYLVHQASLDFFEWASMNADQYAELISNLEKTRTDLETFDQGVARIYGARCKKSPDEMLAVMKEGAWLSAEKALEFGFVDEVTDFPEDSAAELSESHARAMAAAGMNLPPLEVMPEGQSALFGILNTIANFFRNNISTVPAMETPTPAPAAEEQQPDLQAQLEAMTAERDAAIAERDSAIAELDAARAELEELRSEPAASSEPVIETHVTESADDDADDTIECEYAAHAAAARALFDSLP